MQLYNVKHNISQQTLSCKIFHTDKNKCSNFSINKAACQAVSTCTVFTFNKNTNNRVKSWPLFVSSHLLHLPLKFLRVCCFLASIFTLPQFFSWQNDTSDLLQTFPAFIQPAYFPLFGQVTPLTPHENFLDRWNWLFYKQMFLLMAKQHCHRFTLHLTLQPISSILHGFHHLLGHPAAFSFFPFAFCLPHNPLEPPTRNPCLKIHAIHFVLSILADPSCPLPY